MSEQEMTDEKFVARHVLITDDELADLREIDRLLDEANAHALAVDPHCKSSEGHISVSFGNHWDRYPRNKRKPVEVEIYSYLLGPHRNHHFDNTRQALRIVRAWHENEMGKVSTPDPYLAIEKERQNKFEDFCREMDAWDQ